MTFKRRIIVFLFAVCISAFADEQEYARLKQSYTDTLELLNNAGVREKIILPNPITAQRLSEFRRLYDDFSMPITLKDYKKTGRGLK